MYTGFFTWQPLVSGRSIIRWIESHHLNSNIYITHIICMYMSHTCHASVVYNVDYKIVGFHMVFPKSLSVTPPPKSSPTLLSYPSSHLNLPPRCSPLPFTAPVFCCHPSLEAFPTNSPALLSRILQVVQVKHTNLKIQHCDAFEQEHELFVFLLLGYFIHFPAPLVSLPNSFFFITE